ncbi:hypothetical protein NDU88_001721 [Pleurodeles waltl]|uniref:Uncharacterized protein n=1 Tax=Pleurodeles waltl TaxID=8319 RepID=A0AAV7U775_PLEWA|nr:hypothetical protein NDU88_001721 [Pleurodeles waltl]
MRCYARSLYNKPGIYYIRVARYYRGLWRRGWDLRRGSEDSLPLINLAPQQGIIELEAQEAERLRKLRRGSIVKSCPRASRQRDPRSGNRYERAAAESQILTWVRSRRDYSGRQRTAEKQERDSSDLHRFRIESEEGGVFPLVYSSRRLTVSNFRESGEAEPRDLACLQNKRLNRVEPSEIPSK